MAFVLVAQLSTMLLIGLWHGVTLNFAIWGLWHGVGLFAHKLLADNTRAWYLRVVQTRWKRRLIYAGGVFATFHYVALGWVFFALPEPADSLDMLARLFGLR
jgi:D-alanyl-lipoteichoic acid acyltransferase DltB (MBOAT superfamily)